MFKYLWGLISEHIKSYLAFLRDIRGRNDGHDKLIFRKANDILSDEQIQLIIQKTSIGYFPDDLLWAYDGLDQFVNSTSNEFLSKELQSKLINMSRDLGLLADVYVESPFTEVVGNGFRKLLGQKEGLTDDEARKILNKNKQMRENFINSYNEYRRAIKKILAI